MVKSIGKWTVLVSLILVCPAEATDKGLVAYYDFEEGASTKLHDRSGNGNDGKIIGGAKWVAGPYGTALEFDGKDDYVDCGASESLESIESSATIAVWCYPKALQGGIMNWGTGAGRLDSRLSLFVATAQGIPDLRGWTSNGEHYDNQLKKKDFGDLVLNEWAFIAWTFNGKSIHAYRDSLRNNVMGQNIRPEITGTPLWIGRSGGFLMLPDKTYFKGLIDEVRIYNQALSPHELLTLYKQEAAARVKDTASFQKVKMEAHVYPGPGKISVDLDASAMRPLPDGTKLRASLYSSASPKPIQRLEASIPAVGTAEAILDSSQLDPGEYVIRAAAFGPDGKQIGEKSSENVSWPGRPAELNNAKILNTMVWELLNADGTSQKYSFTCPYDRWVFIRTDAEVRDGGKIWISVDSDSKNDAAIVHADGKDDLLEAMRFLSAGEHTIHVQREGHVTLHNVVVRAIPMLQYIYYTGDERILSYAPYDWEFLSKDILPNVNTIISGEYASQEHLTEWKEMGRKWIKAIPIGGIGKSADLEEAAYEYFSGSEGMQRPLMDGIIVDSFDDSDHPRYDAYRKAIERIHADPQFKGRTFSPYWDLLLGRNRSLEAAGVAMAGGGYVCLQRYIYEHPTAEAAQTFIERDLPLMIPTWEQHLPGSTRQLVIALGGYMAVPNCFTNIDPTVNLKVSMEMQYRFLATHPIFFGLGGIQEYHSGYADEETVRWAGRLYRHYCIEGNTEPLGNDPYKLTHIDNPDFSEGTSGWTLSPAEEGSIAVKQMRYYGKLQGRGSTYLGDTFLWMKRNAKKPNVFFQIIKDLEPGRLYCMKMITADYQNIKGQKSVEQQDALSITFENAEEITGPGNNFQSTYPCITFHAFGKFTSEYPAWMNFHWHVFRAKGNTARLVVSDWANPADPGGPIGQELMFNFIELQPYLE